MYLKFDHIIIIISHNSHMQYYHCLSVNMGMEALTRKEIPLRHKLSGHCSFIVMAIYVSHRSSSHFAGMAENVDPANVSAGPNTPSWLRGNWSERNRLRILIFRYCTNHKRGTLATYRLVHKCISLGVVHSANYLRISRRDHLHQN